VTVLKDSTIFESGPSPTAVR